MKFLRLKYKILIKSIFLFLLFLNFDFVFADNYLINCSKNFFITEDVLENEVKKIEINVKKGQFKKWTRNSVAILTSKNRTIENKNKKRFKSKLKLSFDAKSKSCTFNASIRQSGDWKDHIKYKSTKPREIYQSLDVKLLDGNIEGITRFKLLLPETRYFKEEIILLEILKDLNFITPRTYLTNLSINNQAFQKVIFQENPVKELLEYNKKFEGPILEGDEKFLWNFPKKGNFFISEDIALSRVINSNWALRNNSNLFFSLEALTALNKVYLNRAINFDKKEYSLNNFLLANGNNEHYEKLNNFDLLMLVTESYHALRPHNRKFYYNKIYKNFHPIYYEGMPKFRTNELILPNSFMNSKQILLDYFNNFDFKKFLNQINQEYKITNDEELKIKINNVITNLKNIKFTSENENLDGKETDLGIDEYLNNFTKYNNDGFSFINKNSPNKIFFCDNYKKKCEERNLIIQDSDLVISILNNRFKNKKKYHQFIGYVNNKKKLSFKTNHNAFFNQYFEKDEIKIFYNQNIDLKINENKIFLKQLNEDGRVLILNSNLENISILFEGFKKEFIINDNFNKNYYTTGCLTFYNNNFKNTIIETNNSICEDSINILNSSGNIKKLVSNFASYDGIDIDFSKVSIDEVVVNNSLNDCIDFSYGIYKINRVNLNKCGDKGISVGENSSLEGEKLKISNSNIAIAVKDSSKGYFKDLLIQNVDKCYAAYRKKQEFSGGYIEIVNEECNIFNKKTLTDQISKIKFLN